MRDIKSLPTCPGVYLYKNKTGEIIYVGKAKNLRSRVSSYFHSSGLSPKTRFLVSHIDDLDFIMVDTEVEALLLENKLIKQHNPKYNISLKDSKTYAYILVTADEFPRIVAERSTRRKGKYFGPYTDGMSRFEIMQLTVKLFQLRVCRTLPKRACLNYHIGLCTAPCIGAVSVLQYGEQVKGAVEFLSGNTAPVVSLLEREMQEASASRQYEVALEKKKQLEAIYILSQRQKVDLIKKFDQDVIACFVHDNLAIITLFSIKKGVILGKKEFRFEFVDDIVRSFICRYYAGHAIPEEILLSERCFDDDGEKVALEDYLTSLKWGNNGDGGHSDVGGRSRVHLVVPLRGEKFALVQMALRNAQFGSSEKILEEMQVALRLPTVPRVIECFDISNLGYDYIVAGMTQWVDGKVNPSGYRRFQIKSVVGKNDDFASIKEVVMRRYSRLVAEGRAMPDLIIIDGGAVQLRMAREALAFAGVGGVPVVSLAKRDEEIYVPFQDIPFKFEMNSPMMLFIRRIRDSVHDYVLSYNRKKREMRVRDEFEKASSDTD